MLQFGASLTDDARSANYDRNMFIIQATGDSFLKSEKFQFQLVEKNVFILSTLIGLAKQKTTNVAQWQSAEWHYTECPNHQNDTQNNDIRRSYMKQGDSQKNDVWQNDGQQNDIWHTLCKVTLS